mmetsp:Transcript_11487/g.21268  ORF Transcript_11487/g.21268 Transcript_11487/m.21268 type:complete len:233 (-) Transcript_11487:25-723(-)
MNNTQHARNLRGGMPSLAYGAVIALATTLIIIAMQHFLLASKQPESTRMDMMNRAKENYLRSHPRHSHSIMDQFMSGHSHLRHDHFFPSNTIAKDDQDDFLPSIWHDEFFGPLLESPFMNELRKQQHMMMMEPAFKMDEDGDQVSLVMSIPDVPLKDIDIEVIGGRIIHIKGEKITSSSRVSFDKRFSIGQHLNESNLKAKLTKDGDLVVSAPKVATGEKEEVRKIPIAEEL